MIPRSVGSLAQAVDGRMIAKDATIVAEGVGIDSRTIAAHDVFFAIIGANHDGHRFIGDAAERGCRVFVVSDAEIAAEVERAGDTFGAVVLVDDTTSALGRLAADERRKRKMKVVAITGSAGKTTTRLLTEAALSAKFQTAGTRGNLNNHWGLPLSILSLPLETEVAVLEMGMNHAGEIRALSKIARPDVAVITNIGEAHLGHFRSVDDIAAAKAEILEDLGADGWAVLNAADRCLEPFAEKCRAKVKRFGTEGKCDLRGELLSSGGLEGARFRVEESEVRLQLWGGHAVENALAALCTASIFGVNLVDAAGALARVEALDGRGRRHRLRDGSIVIDESYNASPGALRRVIEALDEVEWHGRRVAVLGEMLELGDFAAAKHQEVARRLSRSRFDSVHTVGCWHDAFAAWTDAMRDRSLSHHRTSAEASRAVLSDHRRNDLVLIKGSRSIGLETIVADLDRTIGREVQR